MLNLKTPRGLPVRVPETLDEDPSPRFAAAQAEQIRDYYLQHGYVVVKQLIAPAVCDRQRALWDREVKPFGGFIYRQATARAERHVRNANGWVMNPILNLQSVDPKQFPEFRRHATEQVLASKALSAAFRALLGDAPKLVQSMYFEGNSATWEHQDSYYLDSERIGEMAAAWIALEDIAAHAGRFFICPGSHRIRLGAHGLDNNVVEHHEVYIRSVVERIEQLQLEIRAPALQRGDVLFWNALTIHGSLDSQDADHSRSSITCHAIPNQRRFLSHQTRLSDPPTDVLNDTFIFRPKDLAMARNRAILAFESSFPALFYWVKKRAVVHAMRRKERLEPMPSLGGR